MSHTLFHDCDCPRCERRNRFGHRASGIAALVLAVFLLVLWFVGRQ